MKNEIIYLQKTFKKEGLGQIRIAKLNAELMFNLYDTCFYLGYTKEAKGHKYLFKDRIENICKTLDIKGLYVGYNNSVTKSVDTTSTKSISITKDIDFENTWIDEQSFYDLCLESHAKNARSFRRWVTGEVLPSIRKTGFYSTEKAEQLKIQEPYKLIKKFYNGNPVMVLKDLEFVTGIPLHTISYHLRNDKNFTIDTDYFFLEGIELKKFKKDNKLSPWIGSLIVISKQGVDKMLNILLLKPEGELRETFERYFELENQAPQGKNKAPVLEQLQACKFIADDMKVGEAVKMSIYRMICEKNGIDIAVINRLKAEYSKKLDKELLEIAIKYGELLLENFTTEGIIALKEETIAEEPIISGSRVVKKYIDNFFGIVLKISKKYEEAAV